MPNYTKKDILRLVEEEDVSFIRLQFTDVLGRMRNIAVTSDKIEDALNNECYFDGSSIEGFSETRDMYLVPDLDTFNIFPWRPHTGRVARLICDVYTSDNKRFACDPRYVLKRAVNEAAELGFEFNVGAECEFFLFKTDENGNPTAEPHDSAGFFDLAPMDNGENCRRDISLTLEEMGFIIEASHHEAAPGQHEIDIKYDKALSSADGIVTFKNVVKTLAKRNGLHATFMPKPLEGVSGSGMHINMSLYKDGVNMFYDENGERKISELGYKFLAGIFKYTPDMMCITNPTVNSYKRLMPGPQAPCYPVWADKNTSPLVRIPSVKKPDNARIELRSPDCTSNPYLVLATCLSAGLRGIKEELPMPENLDIDISKLSYAERRKLISDKIPASLNQAVKQGEQSEFLKEVLGEELKKVYIEIKEDEYARYRQTVSKWEMDNYFIAY
ncbi:MAG: type I glutamate--ammonia ligase [Clostridia bacterium]|nr:type I glutamate--ammonia ligase [Clostridia bacterium]